MTIRHGETIGAAGRAGSGKSTWLKVLMRLVHPTRGRVVVGGVALETLSRESIAKLVGYVSQTPVLFAGSVADNIAFGLKMQKLPRREIAQRVEQITRLVSLAGMEDRRPSQLSGGQRQRVALARAIVCQPKVLLLDEPLAALDAKLRRAMQVELKRLQEQLKITFVFVTHDQEEALILSDRIAVMNAGTIEQLGSAEEVYHRPTGEFVASFIGQTNLLSVTVVRPRRVRAETGFEFDVASDHPIGTKLLVMIRPERIQIVPDSSPPPPTTFTAQIIERIFRGNSTQLIVRADGGQTLQIVKNDTSPGSSMAGEITCRIDPGDAVVIDVR
jgi:spermidine/putrescine transport system ATP-binding protein